MKSKISFFNAGIFKSMLKRFWPLWAVYLAGWFLGLPLLTLVERINGGPFIPAYFTSLQELFRSELISSFIMAILVAMAMYSFLYSSRSTGLIASMPVRREAVFCSAYLAGLLPVVAANLIIAALNFVFTLGSPVSTGIVLKANALLFAGNSMCFVIFYGIAVLIAMMTSNIVALPALYVIFNFLFLGMEQIIRIIFHQFIFGFADEFGSTLEFLSPIVYLFGKVNMDCAVVSNLDYSIVNVTSVNFTGFSYVLIYFAAGIALSVIALLIFRKHRMESSGDVIAIPCLRPVFKYGVAACAALCFGLFFYVVVTAMIDNCAAEVFILGMIIGAFIGYFASDMLINKSFHVFRGNWVGFIIFSCCCVIFVLFCAFDVFGIAKSLPDASEVESVVCPNQDAWLQNEEDIAKLIEVNKAIIADRDKYETFEYSQNDTPNSIEIHYVLKNGNYISREYTVNADKNFYAFCDVLNSPDIVIERFTPGIEVNAKSIYSAYFTMMVQAEQGDDQVNLELTPEQAEDFYLNALIPDIKNGAKKLVYPGQYDKYDTNAYAEISLDFVGLEKQPNGAVEETYDSMYIEIDPECTLCIQWVKANLNIDLAEIFAK